MNKATEMMSLVAVLADTWRLTQHLTALDDELSVNLAERADQVRAWALREQDKREALFNLLLIMPHGEYLRLLQAIGEDT